MSHAFIRNAITGVACAAALSCCAASAHAAQTAKLDFRCKFPLLGTQKVELDVNFEIPETLPLGAPIAPLRFQATASVGTDRAIALVLRDSELSVIGGVSDAQQPGRGTAAKARVELADGSGIEVRVPIDIEPYSYDANWPPPLVLKASGTTPSLTFDVAGGAKVVLTDLTLNLYAHYADGTPFDGLLTPPTDLDRQPYEDIDGDPGTFNVPCKLDPAGQNPQLAAFEVTASSQPPTKPGAPTANSATTDRIQLDWARASDDKAVAGYDVFRGETKIATVSSYGGPVTATGLTADTAYEFRVEAFGADGARTSSDTATLRTAPNVAGRQTTRIEYRCKFPMIGTTPVTFDFGADVPDTLPVGKPTASFPVNVRATVNDFSTSLGILFESVSTLSSVDGQATTGAGSAIRLSVVSPSGRAAAARVPVAYAPFALIPPRPDFWVLDGSGNLPPLTVTEPGTTRIEFVGPDLNLRVRSADGSPLEGFRTPPTDIDREPYPDVDGDPDTFNVPCKPMSATQSLTLASFEAVSAPSPVKYGYTLAGSTTLKTLTKGTLALKGGIDAELTLATGAFTADLALNDTSGRLVAAGFLPVTAKIGFVPSGKTTGTLIDGVLKSKSLVRIKVKEVKLFGAIPLAGGNTCQTRQLSEINLQSTQAEFSPLVGGPIAGTYKISDLNGCGALNGLVSPLTAGSGNTISLALTPKAS